MATATNTNALVAFNPPAPGFDFRCRLCLHNHRVYDCKTLASMKSHLGSYHHMGPWYCSICGQTECRGDHVGKHINDARLKGHVLGHAPAVIMRDQILQDIIVEEAHLCKWPHPALSPGNGVVFGIADAFGPVTQPGAPPSNLAVNPVISAVVTPGNTSVPAAAAAVSAALAVNNAGVQAPPAGQAIPVAAAAGYNPASVAFGRRILAGIEEPPSTAPPAAHSTATIDLPWCVDLALQFIEPYINRLHHDTDPTTREYRLIMEGNLRYEVAQITHAQNVTQVRNAIHGASNIIERYRELMVEEGDEHEVAAIDEEKVHIGIVERAAGRLIAQGL